MLPNRGGRDKLVATHPFVLAWGGSTSEQSPVSKDDSIPTVFTRPVPRSEGPPYPRIQSRWNIRCASFVADRATQGGN